MKLDAKKKLITSLSDIQISKEKMHKIADDKRSPKKSFMTNLR